MGDQEKPASAGHREVVPARSANFLMETSDWIDENRRIVQLAVSGLGVCVLGYAVYRTRMFHQFRRAHEIPVRFYRRRLCLNGVLRDVSTKTDRYGQLEVVHVPIMQFGGASEETSRFGRDDLLPLSLANLQLTKDGIVWLWSFKRERVSFRLLKHDSDRDLALVVLYVRRKLAFTDWPIPGLYRNANKALLKHGLATISDANSPLLDNKYLGRYDRWQSSAVRWQLGVWSAGSLRPVVWLKVMGNYLRARRKDAS